MRDCQVAEQLNANSMCTIVTGSFGRKEIRIWNIFILGVELCVVKMLK